MVGLLLWFWLGSPLSTLANLFWSESNAPWETVDAFYYPDASNLFIHEEMTGFESVDDCRRWARQMAWQDGDPEMRRSDYECGVGFVEYFASDVKVYRLTVR